MAKGKGGRGNKNPYTDTHIRVPNPIKAKIERNIRRFREAVEKGEIVLQGNRIYSQPSLVKEIDWNQVVEACDRYIEENSLTPFMHTRNNVTFSRFREWAKKQDASKGKRDILDLLGSAEEQPSEGSN